MQDKIFTEANSKICLSLIEKYFSAPKAKYDKRRNEYMTLSPLRSDEHVKAGTFSINTITGLYNDKATGDKGNFIQLVSHKFGLTLKQAAEKIISDSGGIVSDDKRHNMPEKKDSKEKPKAIIPIPPGTELDLQKIVQSQYNRDLHGKAVKIYIYKNYNQQAVMCVCRYEKAVEGKEKPDKEHIPYYYTAKGWRAGRPDAKVIPLYNEDKLVGWNGPILIVEGEGCASVKVKGYLLLSWLGGCENAHNANWEILKDCKGKKINWPDYDEAGMKAAMQIKKILPDLEVLDIQKGIEK